MVWIWTFFLAIIFINLLLNLLGPKNRKKLPPGPIGLPFLGHFHLLGKNPHRDLQRLARKHGPIMGLRFGPVPTVIVSSPAAAELVLKTHDLVFASRPPNKVARVISYDRDMVFGPYGPHWRDMRKFYTSELLNSSTMKQLEGMRRAEVGLLVRPLKEAGERREAVDLSGRISTVSQDMNFLMILGRKYSDGDVSDEGSNFKALLMEGMEIGAKFNLADYFPYADALDLQGINRKINRLSNIFDRFLEKIIDDHVGKEEREGFVGTMMAIMESGEAGFELDRRQIKATLLDLLIAGTDTSAITTDWAISELMRQPPLMKKLQQELESTVGLDRAVEESDLGKLEYLDFVVKEVLRLHPVAPLLIPHESMEDCELQGFHVPKKARVIVNAWAIGRDPNVWSDPDSFRPERFVGSDVDVRGHHFELLPFGSGRRSCPGMELGLTVVKLVVAQLVHCFDWKLPEGHGDVDMTEHFGLLTCRAVPLVAVPTYRLHVA